MGIATGLWLQNLAMLKENGVDIAQHLLMDASAISALQAGKFDLVLRDFILWPTQLLSEILEIPEVELVSTGVVMPYNGRRASIPNPIAYIPQMGSALHPNMVSQASSTDCACCSSTSLASTQVMSCC